MDTSISELKTARFTTAAKAGVNMTPIRECSLADHRAWAAAAPAAYNRHAPKALLPVPELTERVRLGVLAAETMAQIAFSVPVDQVVDDQESADRVIGDLVAQVFCLTEGRVTAHKLRQAAEGLRSEAYPVKLDALCPGRRTQPGGRSRSRPGRQGAHVTKLVIPAFDQRCHMSATEGNGTKPNDIPRHGYRQRLRRLR